MYNHNVVWSLNLFISPKEISEILRRFGVYIQVFNSYEVSRACNPCNWYTMSLADFPPDVLANILGYTQIAGAAAAVFDLWKCGDTTLNYKLQHGGCQTLELVNTTRRTRLLLPQLVFDGTFQLHTLHISHYAPLPADTLHKIGPSLKHLVLECPDIKKVVDDLNYATRWPVLESLELWASTLFSRDMFECTVLPNYLHRLPPTVTKLITPGIDAPLLDVFNALPRELVTFHYLPSRIPANELSMTCDLLKALPPTIEDLQIQRELWRLTSYEQAPLLPVGLRHLSMLSYHNDKDVVLPQQLKSLAITQDADTLDRDTRLKIPASVTNLTMILSNRALLRTQIGIIPTVRNTFSPTQWLQWMPPCLTQFNAIHHPFGLPLDWQQLNRSTCIWPSTLKSINICIVDTPHLALLSFPRGIELIHISLKPSFVDPRGYIQGMLTNATTPCLTTLNINFVFSDALIAQLPSSLTELDISQTVFGIVSPMNDWRGFRDYRSLTALKHLVIGSQMFRLGNHHNQYLQLPESLQRLTCLTNYGPLFENVDLSLDETLQYFLSLPFGLEELVCSQSCVFALNARTAAALPPNLKELQMKTLMTDEPAKIIKALPRLLSSLVLRSSILNHCLDASQLHTMLPPKLNTLHLTGYQLTNFDWSQPIPSLRHVAFGLLSTQDKSWSPDQFALLFPNATYLQIVRQEIQ